MRMVVNVGGVIGVEGGVGEDSGEGWWCDWFT